MKENHKTKKQNKTHHGNIFIVHWLQNGYILILPLKVRLFLLNIGAKFYPQKFLKWEESNCV